jgi:hypothetical protein
MFAWRRADKELLPPPQLSLRPARRTATRFGFRSGQGKGDAFKDIDGVEAVPFEQKDVSLRSCRELARHAKTSGRRWPKAA